MVRERRGSISPLLVLFLVAAAAAGVGAIMLAGPARGATSSTRADLFTVQEGKFDVTIPAGGEILAQRQLEIRNELEVGAVITEIVDEGVFVSAGDVLMRLNDEQIREQIREQQDIVNNARNSLAAATANLAIRKSETDSQIANADLKIRLAELSLEAWEKGTVISTQQDLQLELATAEKEYDRIVAQFAGAENLLKKEFISLDKYRETEIDLISAKADLETAKLAIKVYNEYQFYRDQADLESQLAQAQDERERMGLVTTSEIESATSEVTSREFQLENATARLEKLERQLVACTLHAPTDGLVVYASSIESGNNWRQDEDPPQIGTQLSRNQLVMILPDTTRMIAEVKIGEALSGLIEAGQRVAVTSEAVEDRIFAGVVQSIGVMAQSAGWRGPTRRDYTVRVLLDGNGNALGLKPSLRCKAHIFVGAVEESKYVPVQAIHYAGGITYVFKRVEDGYVAQPVTVGRASELFIQLLDGLELGDQVLLRQPQSNEIIGEMPESKRTETTGIDDGEDEQRPVDPMEADGAERRQNLDEAAGGAPAGGGGAGAGGFQLPDGVTMEQLQEWGQVYRDTGEWPDEVPESVRTMLERMRSGRGGGGAPRGSEPSTEGSDDPNDSPPPAAIEAS